MDPRKTPRTNKTKSLTEDDIYHYLNELSEMEDLDDEGEEFLNHSDFGDPLWYLHPSDEDNDEMTTDVYYSTDPYVERRFLNDPWSVKTNIGAPKKYSKTI
jgi:hypothetical protein